MFLYNLNYLNYIFSYSLKDSLKIINSWIDNNKIEYSSIAWDIYPTSLRLVNLIKWSLKHKYKSSKLTDSISIHASYLIKNFEYHLGGNHLLSNYKALIFTFFYFKKSFKKNVQNKIINQFIEELNKQILSDGGHYEQSPMYHNQIIFDLLDIIQLKNISSKNYKIIESKLQKMLYWSKVNNHNGDIPYFNDSCSDIQPSYKYLIKYAQKIGIRLNKNFYKEKKLYFFRDSGYIIYANSKYKIIFRSGEIQSNSIPAHQHANLLSFEISNKFKKIFSNSGISTYENSKKRLIERGTLMQNTLSVEKKNNIDIWKSFRVGKRPNVKSKILSNKKECVVFEGEHDGFSSYLLNKIKHNRKISCYPNKIEIEDSIIGKGTSKIYINFYLDNHILVKKNKEIISLKSKSFPSKITFISDCKNIKIKNSKINKNFFHKNKNKNISLFKESRLSFKNNTTIIF